MSGQFTFVFAITNDGTAVGSSRDSQGFSHPCVWSPSGLTFLAPFLGGIDAKATRTNDSGAIAGFGSFDSLPGYGSWEGAVSLGGHGQSDR